MPNSEIILNKKQLRAAIIEAVAQKHGVNMLHMMGSCRSDKTARARWEAFALIKAYTDDSYPEIGRLFGKNHSTIIYGIARYFGFLRPVPCKGLKGACQDAKDGMEIFGEQLKLEAALYVTEANRLKWQARLANPVYAALMGDSHAA